MGTGRTDGPKLGDGTTGTLSEGIGWTAEAIALSTGGSRPETMPLTILLTMDCVGIASGMDEGKPGCPTLVSWGRELGFRIEFKLGRPRDGAVGAIFEAGGNPGSRSEFKGFWLGIPTGGLTMSVTIGALTAGKEPTPTLGGAVGAGGETPSNANS